MALFAATYGIGFLQDRQYPQLTALFRDDIRTDEGWRMSLLAQWQDYATKRAGAASPERAHVRLRWLADVLRGHGLTGDPVAIFHAIDPVQTGLHAPDQWHRVCAAWRADFNQAMRSADASQLDYACAIAFCCGQHFAFDPLWDGLRDLRPESLFRLVG